MLAIGSMTAAGEEVYDILKKEVGIVFSKVLEHAGVYKRTEEGQKAFDRFINSIIQKYDLIDKDVNLTNDDYKELTDLLSKIDSKYGKYAILGNHDYENEDKVKNIYNESNFIYLDNDYDILYDKSNQKIFIGGVNTASHKLDDIDKTLNYIKENNDINYKIVLIHEPDIADKIVKDYSVNLILAGHSHNGQIRLPIVGPIYTPPYSKKYYDNYYNLDDTSLYISSGIGVSTINYRLWNRPSINFYRINKETSH